MKKDLQLHPFCPHIRNELSDADMDKRLTASKAMLRRFSSAEIRQRVIFTDECAVYLSSRTRNVLFWSRNNPHFIQEIKNHPPYVMVWAGVSGEHAIGPFFFTGNVNAQTYLEMLQSLLIPELSRLGILGTSIFQQDGAPAHYARIVRDYLDGKFPGRWIGRGSPCSWPPRSPDLTTCDN